MDSGPPVNPDPRRRLPAVDRLGVLVRSENPRLPSWAAVEASRRVLAQARQRLGDGASVSPPGEYGEDLLVAQALEEASRLASQRPRPVVNATGVVLHTNLGRAPLCEVAARAAFDVAVGYSDLELERESGRRGGRLANVSEKLRLLSGAPAAHVCNNNAAALLLALDTLARGREVIVSRGELVEIGGSFRVPDIMERSGVRLVEVGTTNRTHVADYEEAIGPETALLLKVHRSNFTQKGFVAEVDLGTLAGLGRKHGLAVLQDLGSGSLVDLASRGFPADCYAPASLDQGADLVCFSGDKLLGGPQAGILLGEALPLEALSRNPLARALRLDKMSLAALDATLGVVLEGRAESELPVLRRLLEPCASLERRARALAKRLRECAGERLRVDVERDHAEVGGGSLPGFALSTWVVKVSHADGAERLAARLRRGEIPVLARVRDEAVWLDLRTLEERDCEKIEDAVGALLR